MQALQVPMEREDYQTCAIRALMEMFAQAKQVSCDNVALVMSVVLYEGTPMLEIRPVVVQ
jgi:hypothetical protein